MTLSTQRQPFVHLFTYTSETDLPEKNALSILNPASIVKNHLPCPRFGRLPLPVSCMTLSTQRQPFVHLFTYTSETDLPEKNALSILNPASIVKNHCL